MNEVYAGLVAILPGTTTTRTEILRFTLNLIVTLCTESIGFVHSVALKSALASEYRLSFNTNLRLFTAARANPWTNPNGTLFNALMAISLVVSYVSSSLVFLPFESEVSDDSSHEWISTCLSTPPVTALGVTLLLQAVIALAGIYNTEVPTWNSSALDTTAALLHNAQITHVPGRCMHNVIDSTSYYGPRPPSERQPSAWQSHPNVKTICILLWCLAGGYIILGGIAVGIWAAIFRDQGVPGLNSWSFLPSDGMTYVGYVITIDPTRGWAWFPTFVVLAACQGSLTFGLHCSEVIVNVVRDEMAWRKATKTVGTTSTKNPVTTAFGNWPNIGLLVAKPVLRKYNLCLHGIFRRILTFSFVQTGCLALLSMSRV